MPVHFRLEHDCQDARSMSSLDVVGVRNELFVRSEGDGGYLAGRERKNKLFEGAGNRLVRVIDGKDSA